MLTDMDQPLGRAVGNSLEVAEAIATLRGEGPPDLVALARIAGAEMLLLGVKARDRAVALRRIDQALADGSGLAKLRALVVAQGGDPRMVDDPGRLPRAPHVETLRATRTAYVRRIAADAVGNASVRLGAGREKKGDPIDHRTGILLHAKVGARVERGAAFAEVHHAGRPGDAAAIDQVREAFAWSARPVARPKLVLGRVAG
jgi:pyrimidine-nucleoside phosphorylase